MIFYTLCRVLLVTIILVSEILVTKVRQYLIVGIDPKNNGIHNL